MYLGEREREREREEKNLLQNLNSRIMQVESCNFELTQSLEYTQISGERMKNKNTSLKEEIMDLKKEITTKTNIEDYPQILKDRLDHQDYSRRNNLRFTGIEECLKETWEVTQDKIQRLLRDQMSQGTLKLERAHRVGFRNSLYLSRYPTVVARFFNFADRQFVLRNSSKLKNTNIFMNKTCVTHQCK